MSSPAQLAFPADFRWGVSTSSYQFEGNNANSGWSDWERKGGIRTGESAGIACDWWRDAERDFDLAQQLGLNAMRISLEWSRLEPSEGEWNQQAVDRYRQMLEGLHARGIQPMVCLHHFSNPRWLERQGSFESRRTIDLFTRYAERACRSLGDLCSDYLTFNEPNVYAVQAWLFGAYPPGKKDIVATGKVLANIGLAHAAAYRAVHGLGKNLRVGLTQHLLSFAPHDPTSRKDRALASSFDTLFNELFLSSVISGSVPWPLRALGSSAAQMRGTADFIGLNVYGRHRIRFDALAYGELFGRRVTPDDAPQGDVGGFTPYGECYPAGITMFARRFAHSGKPLYILEHGVPDRADRIRPWLIAHAARELHRVLQEGTDVRGYFHWSLVDNFEWNEGWAPRFGLASLDRATQTRTLHDSGRLLGAIARSNALRAEDVARYAPQALAEVFSAANLADGENRALNGSGSI